MISEADGRPIISGLKVLIVEPDASVALTLSSIISRNGGEFLRLESFEQGSKHFSYYHPDIAICSVELPDGAGTDLMREWKIENPSMPVILLSDETKLESALGAMRSGAFDFLAKTSSEAQIVMTLTRASEISRLREKVDRMQGRERLPDAQTIIGTSKVTRSLLSSIRKVAKSKCDSCIILGESGVGKELAAHQIHDLSTRAKDPFIEINAASIPENLLESELFGHERGAYTDAKDRKAGLFEIAGAGTIFLDEIGELPLSLQAKLLRVLESRRFKRLGGVKDIELKARIVVATNRDLSEQVASGKFRADLYYRLNVIPIKIPPLRERKGDIGSLTTFFAESLATQLEVGNPIVPDETVRYLEMHPWPGNIRELRNVIYRALVMFEPEVLLPKHLLLDPITMAPVESAARVEFLAQAGSSARTKTDRPQPVIELPEGGIALELVEESLIVQALERCKHNQTKAANMLGISRHALRYRLEKHGLGSIKD